MKKLLPALAAATLLLAAACNNKEYNAGNPAPQPVTQKKLQDVYNELRPQVKSVTLDATTGGTFRGNSGTRYQLPPNAFITMAGLPVTGPVDITVVEALTPSQQIFSKMLPISNGSMLTSGGELRITARQNGNDLRMAPGAYYTARMPFDGGNGASMQFFRGIETGDTTVNVVNWNTIDSSSFGEVVYNGDTISILSDSLGWANADQFISAPNYQTFTINVDGVSGVDQTNALAYALYDTYNASWPMYFSGTGVISENHVPDIPVHFVVFAMVGGQFYGGITAATPANGATYTVTLTAQDPTAFAALVDALP